MVCAKVGGLVCNPKTGALKEQHPRHFFCFLPLCRRVLQIHMEPESEEKVEVPFILRMVAKSISHHRSETPEWFDSPTYKSIHVLVMVSFCGALNPLCTT